MNIYDIAAEAKTSISTVSRVLNHKTNVNPEIKKRVEEVLEKYNYKPSAIARGMVSKSMKSIAVMTVDVRVSHYARTLYVIEQEFSEAGFNVNVCNIGHSQNEFERYVDIITDKNVDGIILIGSVFSRLLKDDRLIDKLKNIPVIMGNGHIDKENFYSVMVDDKNAIRMATEYLYNKGRKNVLYVCDMDTDSAHLKKAGFSEALLLRGEKDISNRIFTTDYGLEGGKEVAVRIIDSKIPCDGIVFGEDITAIGAMKQFKKMGITVPDDIAVIGCNNSQETLICEPELTSIDNKPELQGHLCCDILKRVMNGEKPEQGVYIQTEIRERKTT